MPTDPPSRHACLCAHQRAFARYYHPVFILFSPPNSKSCMKPAGNVNIITMYLYQFIYQPKMREKRTYDNMY